MRRVRRGERAGQRSYRLGGTTDVGRVSGPRRSHPLPQASRTQEQGGSRMRRRAGTTFKPVDLDV